MCYLLSIYLFYFRFRFLLNYFQYESIKKRYESQSAKVCNVVVVQYTCKFSFLTMYTTTFYVFLLFGQIFVVFGMASCPQHCSCRNDVVDCRGKQLKGVPRNIPASTQKLYLGHNQIKVIEKNDFCFLPQLFELQLQNNLIASLSSFVFSGECLPKIQTIQLENNRINFTEAGTFYNISSLLNITLTNNKIAELNTRTFEETSLVFFAPWR